MDFRLRAHEARFLARDPSEDGPHEAGIDTMRETSRRSRSCKEATCARPPARPASGDLRATSGSATLTALLIPCDAAGQKVQKVEAETATEDDLRAEYQRRHDERQEARERWSRLDQHVADARLVVFSAGLMLAFLFTECTGRVLSG